MLEQGQDRTFKPAWWLKGPHLQTLWPVLFRRRIKNLNLENERLELPDGDFIDLNWFNKNGKGPLCIILHGLEGSIHSHYAKSMMKTMSLHGFRVVFMHFRGCSGEPNRLSRGYHSGETLDLQFLVETIRVREPSTPLIAIGYSLGGNVLLKWLGETKDQNPLSAAVAISVPFELHKSAIRIRQGFSKFYQWYFIRCLRTRLMRKAMSSAQLLALKKAKTMYDFDHHITAPLHGFSGVTEYYALSSSRQYMRFIEVPTLIVQSKDDPFMPSDVIPTLAELSKKVYLEVTDRGGHVGFVGGRYPWTTYYWLDQRVPQFFKAVLSL